jgi:predicted DNA-binding protein
VDIVIGIARIFPHRLCVAFVSGDFLVKRMPMLGKHDFATYNRSTNWETHMNKQRTTKSVHSLRLSAEGLRQLRDLSMQTQRSEANVVEIAIDRMYREEIRFGCLSVHEAEGTYTIEEYKDEK